MKAQFDVTSKKEQQQKDLKTINYNGKYGNNTVRRTN